MDERLWEAINGFAARHDGFEELASFLAADAQYIFIALLAFLFLMRGKWAFRNGRHGVMAALLSAGVALLVAHLIAVGWERPRPYVADPGDSHLLIAPSHDPSFPSDHATAAFAIAVSIFLRSRRIGLLALALALLLALARVAVGVHYPGDVAGGALIGTAAALLLWIPPVRGPLHALADWMGDRYERLASRALRSPTAISSRTTM